MQKNPLWDYSVTVYGYPGVESLLLELQDRFGADVNILLACCWLASRERLMTPEMLTTALAETSNWQRQCIQPLRGLRHFLKGQSGQLLFREQVKALEIDAERYQQGVLYGLWQDSPVVPSGGSFQELARQNLQCYGVSLPGVEWRELSESLTLLVSILENGNR